MKSSPPPDDPHRNLRDPAASDPADDLVAAERGAPTQPPEDEDWEAVSLEELGAAYAKVMADAGMDAQAHEVPRATGDDLAADAAGGPASDDAEANPYSPEEDAEDEGPVTPEGIVEAALFVGHPDNRPLSAAELAAMMRGVDENDVQRIVDALNQSYRDAGQALRIHSQESGYLLGLCEAVETVRRAFYGKIREARLSHGAVEVLALVAYQPGIDAQRVQDQRGKESGSLLSQLVRRRLLEVRREKPAEGGRAVATYYPTERFLNLFQLSSLEDLPLVDEADVSPR